MEIRVQKHVHISMVETYECTLDVDIPDDAVEYLENEGHLDDVDWGDSIFVDDNITGEEFSIVD